MNYPILAGSFSAFGSTVSLTGVGTSLDQFRNDISQIRSLSERWDQQFSRFRPDSLVNSVNSSRMPVEVTGDFLRLLDSAIDGARKSGGRFDPAILPALTAAGYRADFAEIFGRVVPAGSPIPSPGLSGIEQIAIDRSARTVLLPPNLQLDFGGIAKGAFADLASDILHGWPGGCIDVGGDLRVWGVAPDGPHWRIGIEHPSETENDLRTVEVAADRASGVATSGINRRHWMTADGDAANHLIDPQSGRPVLGGPHCVTVFAATATEAEISAKAVFIAATRHEPIDLLDGTLAVIVWTERLVDVIQGQYPDATIISTPPTYCQST